MAIMMKYKTEFFMLLTAIIMFVVSALCYSYATNTDSFALSIDLTYPYRAYAIPFISTGTALMGIASVSFIKKNKAASNQQENLQF